MQKATRTKHGRTIAAAGDIPFVPPATLSPTYEEGGYAIYQSHTLPLLLPPESVSPAPGAPLSAVSGHKRYNTLHFQTESRVPTGRSRPYWMTQRKAGRAAFGSVSCGETCFFCRSAHPDVRLVPAGRLIRQRRYAWVRFIVSSRSVLSETHSIR